MSRHAIACAFLLLGAQCGGNLSATTSRVETAVPPALPWESLPSSERIVDQVVSDPVSPVFSADDPAFRGTVGSDARGSALVQPGPDPAGHAGPQTPTSSGLTVKSTEFAVDAIPRAAFAAASEDALPAPWERSREAARRAQAAALFGHGGRPWSDLSLRSAAQRTTYRGKEVGFDATHSLELSRVLSRARVAVKARVTERDDRRFLEEGSVRLETFGGWRGDLGGIAFGDGGPLLSAARGRGISLERDLEPVGRHGVIHTRLAWGRSAVRYENIQAGRYPRSILAGTVHLHAPEGIEVGVDALRLSDPTRGGDQGMAVRQAWSTGIEAMRAGKSSSLEVEATTSGLTEQSGVERRSGRAAVSARAEQGRMSVGASAASAQGNAFRVGPLGAIEPVPAQVLAADLTLRPGGGSFVGMWAGQWKHSSPWGEGTPVLDANLANRASEGRQIGGRIGTTLTRTRSGLSLSMEYRRRALAEQTQRIWTTGASIAQGLGKTAQLSLQANRFAQEGSGPRDYASGNLSVRLWDRATLAVEQQTVWQEPYGAQVLSFVELAASPFGSRALPMSLRVSQSHEQDAGSFRPRQSQASLSGGVRLSREATLSLRVQSTIGRSHRSDAVEVGFRHAFDAGAPGISVATSAAREAARQLLGGAVFEDRNGDGIRSPGEEGIAGVEVVIDNDVRTPVRTDLDGRYRTLLTPGRHLLRLLPESVPTSYALDGTGAVEIEVTADRFAEHDFALERRTGSIRGRLVFGGAGALDPLTSVEAQRVEGLRVLLDDREYTVTDAKGEFVFHALPAGPHEVSIDPASLPPGVRIEGEPRCVVLVGTEGRSEVDCRFVLIRPVVRRRF